MSCSSALDKKTNRKVAIKKVPNAWGNLDDGHRVLREMAILRQLSHYNVNRMVGVQPMSIVGRAFAGRRMPPRGQAVE